MCVGMKQVEVRVIIVQCLEWDFILDKHYNTVTLLFIINERLTQNMLCQQIIILIDVIW